MPKPVAVILLNWNNPTYTINCILSIKKYCKSEEYDLIIADNGSTDGSLDILKGHFPGEIFIDNETNLGFAEGNNRALKYSIEQGYTYSLVINNDAEVDENFLSPLIRHLEAHPGTVAVQPAIYYLHNKTRLWNGGSFFNHFTGSVYSKNRKSRQKLKHAEKVDWVTGCCFLIKNKALTKSGLFNSRFFLYYEDVDLSLRLRHNGGNLDFLPSCKIYHEAGASGQQKVKNTEGRLAPVIHYYLCRNKIWFLRRYAHPFSLIFIFVPNALYYTSLFAYFSIRRRKQKAMFLLKGIKDGLFTPLSNIWQ